MFIKPMNRVGFSSFSAYLMGEAKNAGDNEKCTLVATGNSLGINNAYAWSDYASKLAVCKRATASVFKKPIEHIVLRSHYLDKLTPKMVLALLPELLEALHYQSCPWILAQHIKNGHPHYHLGICRLNDKAKSPNIRARLVCLQLSAKFAREFGYHPCYGRKGDEPYAMRLEKLSGLWDDAETMKPRERLKHIVKNGFIPAAGNRGQLVFVDKESKPHSLLNVPAVIRNKLTHQDIPGSFGLTPMAVKALPHCKKVIASLASEGWKPVRQRLLRRISNEYAKARYDRYYGPCTFSPDRNGIHSSNPIDRVFALPQLSPRYGLRLQIPHQFLPTGARGAGLHGNAQLQSIRSSGHSSPLDSSRSSRAQAAADAVSARYAAAIEALGRDNSLTPDEKAAAIKALQQRQNDETRAARQKIFDEAPQANRPRPRDYSALHN